MSAVEMKTTAEKTARIGCAFERIWQEGGRWMRKKSRMGFVLVGNNGENAGNNKVFLI